MSKADQEYIKKVALELAGAMQQGSNTEVSNLFVEIRKDIKSNADEAKKRMDADMLFQKEVRVTFASIERRAVKWDMSTNGFFTMIGIVVVAVITAIVALVLR